MWNSCQNYELTQDHVYAVDLLKFLLIGSSITLRVSKTSM